jgi:hypothetical protein
MALTTLSGLFMGNYGSRQSLYIVKRRFKKGFIKEKGIASNVLVPDDGESYTL